ncbi:MAG: type II toxin-antitoxin system RelE/ParE family toxin [Flavobacteriales bacterium]|nr:type II toxin-antitoxin system RelE/ParE family toxin [Flavobacteriales bacterium]MCB0757339.1 type II toxin-antitoxin system RelE/ParE family toxin [Flavobacteriales bacterium]
MADLDRARKSFSDGDGMAVARFEADMEQTLAYIEQFPNGFQERRPPFRFAPLAVFRYSIIYALEGNDVVVYRVRHMPQKPLKRFFG